jgi:hypothetical protein
MNRVEVVTDRPAFDLNFFDIVGEKPAAGTRRGAVCLIGHFGPKVPRYLKTRFGIKRGGKAP